MDSYDILVIMLSVALAIFIVVGIIATALLIQVLKRAREISDTAQEAVNHVEQFTAQLPKVGKLSSFGSAATQIFEIYKKGRK